LSEIRKGYAVMHICSGVLRPKWNNGGMGCGCGKAHVMAGCEEAKGATISLLMNIILISKVVRASESGVYVPIPGEASPGLHRRMVS
jgi:hypothetical protein